MEFKLKLLISYLDISLLTILMEQIIFTLIQKKAKILCIHYHITKLPCNS